jgi:hypothetical protein
MLVLVAACSPPSSTPDVSACPPVDGNAGRGGQFVSFDGADQPIGTHTGIEVVLRPPSEGKWTLTGLSPATAVCRIDYEVANSVGAFVVNQPGPIHVTLTSESGATESLDFLAPN